MSSRLMKKVLNEQSGALQRQQLDIEDDSVLPESPAPARNLFNLLEDDDDVDISNNSDDNRSDQVLSLSKL